jgi:hypothetical protein
MDPWFETIGVILVALTGAVLGRLFSCLRKSYWSCGFLIPCILVSMLLVSRIHNTLAFVPPFLWLAAGRTRFVILAFSATMGLTTPMSRLPRKCEKFTIGFLMAVVVFWFSVLPFLVPALIKEELSNLKTVVNPSGVCLQSTNYTCGPAAAVTALRQLGVSAEEGEIAVLSHSSPVAGTLPTCLSTALQRRYGSEGLTCQYRFFESINQLRNGGITLAVVKDGLINSHCVAVLGVTDNIITLADPIWGRMLMSHEEFEKVWQFSGIVLKRNST